MPDTDDGEKLDFSGYVESSVLLDAKSYVEGADVIVNQKVKNMVSDRWLRVIVTAALLALIVYLNVEVISMISYLAERDYCLIVNKTINPEGRLITVGVIQSLIAASVAQIAAMFTIAIRFLYSKTG